MSSLLATGGCLIAGRSLKATLPATAGALFHLGTFLVPIDVAAIGVHADLDWSTLLLAEGLIATATFGWAAITERSVVLRSAFAVSVVALAGGIGATTVLPAPLVLAAFAAAALAVAPRRPGHRLGRAGGRRSAAHLRRPTSPSRAPAPSSASASPASSPALAAVLTGVTAAVVLGVAGRRRHDAGLVLLGVALGAVGAIASWSGQEHDGRTTRSSGLAAVVPARASWSPTPPATTTSGACPSGIVAHIVEWFAGLGTLAAVLPILLAPASDDDQHGDGPRHPGARRRLARRRPSARLARPRARRRRHRDLRRLGRRLRHRVRPRPRPHPHGDRRRWRSSAATGPARRSPCSPPRGHPSWPSSPPPRSSPSAWPAA